MAFTLLGDVPEPGALTLMTVGHVVLGRNSRQRLR
jgi:hypothetical protein